MSAQRPATIRLATPGTLCTCEHGLSPHDARWAVEFFVYAPTAEPDYHDVAYERRTMCTRSFERVLDAVLNPSEKVPE